MRSRLERDLFVGDVAFRRTVRPSNVVVCKRGFLVETNRPSCCRMTPKGWIAIPIARQKRLTPN